LGPRANLAFWKRGSCWPCQ
jgi:hypothetical protein